MTASPTGPRTSGPGTDPPHDGRDGHRGGRRGRLLPAVTFVVGLAIGGGLIWATGPRAADTSGPAAEGPSPKRSGATAELPPGSSARATAVTVPASCLRLAGEARRATALLDDAAVAARVMDTARLADLVRQLGQVDDALNGEASACRDAAASGGVAVPPVPSGASGPSGTAG